METSTGLAPTLRLLTTLLVAVLITVTDGDRAVSRMEWRTGDLGEHSSDRVDRVCRRPPYPPDQRFRGYHSRKRHNLPQGLQGDLIRQQILAATLLEAEKWWYLSELASPLGTSPSSLQRELGVLTRSGG
jgi:hypothetical protein